jgi:hypothetical protein
MESLGSLKTSQNSLLNLHLHWSLSLIGPYILRRIFISKTPTIFSVLHNAIFSSAIVFDEVVSVFPKIIVTDLTLSLQLLKLVFPELHYNLLLQKLTYNLNISCNINFIINYKNTNFTLCYSSTCTSKCQW